MTSVWVKVITSVQRRRRLVCGGEAADRSSRVGAWRGCIGGSAKRGSTSTVVPMAARALPAGRGHLEVCSRDYVGGAHFDAGADSSI